MDLPRGAHPVRRQQLRVGRVRALRRKRTDRPRNAEPRDQAALAVALSASGPASRSHKAKMLLHGHKIAIVVQQRAAAFNAKRADNDVVRFADRYSHIPETTIVPRGARGEIGVEERHDLEAAQAALDTRRGKLIASALKNFKQNEIANKDRLEGHRSFEF